MWHVIGLGQDMVATWNLTQQKFQYQYIFSISMSFQLNLTKILKKVAVYDIKNFEHAAWLSGS